MTTKQAREKMRKELEDPGFRLGYIANISCLLYDNQRTPSTRENLKTIEGSNRMAERLLKLIFE